MQAECNRGSQCNKGPLALGLFKSIDMKNSNLTMGIVMLFGVFMISCNSQPSSPAQTFALGDVDSFASDLESRFNAITQADGQVSKDSLRKMKNEAHKALSSSYPICYDWWLQDAVDVDWFKGSFENQATTRLFKVANDLGRRIRMVSGQEIQQYMELCTDRRKERIGNFVSDRPQIVFTKFRTLLPSFFAYTEGQSDARAESNFFPGGELAMITMDGIWAKEQTLIKDSVGGFRDPDVDFDGNKVLFSWRKSFKEDDFHLYEMDMKTRKVRQITEGKGAADIEAIYLPDGNILFNSTRSGSSVDCWYTEVSNLYLCDRDGKYMRQVGFDQVHTVSPTLLDDGRIVYTRWDYNDRAQVFTQPLFQMNPDGTAQTEYYGMNSWFPTTVAHARQIPGTRKIMATFMGHHNPQHGKLGIIDPEAGRNENEGVMFVAPQRKPEAEKIDSYGQFTDQFQHPFPLNENEFLISYTPLGYHVGHPMMFGVYWMNVDGARELLVSDPNIACNQPRMLAERERPFKRPSTVDYNKSTGVYYVQNIYEGMLMDCLPKDVIKKLRVVEIEFRAAGIGKNENNGELSGALCSSPVGVGNTSWDVKKVHGEVDVYADGSAFFEAPARVPLYFQALDSNGHMVQTMRSWSTLQPGEMQSCVGCHEHKNSVPVSGHPVSIAMDRGVQKLTPIDNGGIRGFSFVKEVQPILDQHCISCHDGKRSKMNLTGEQMANIDTRRKFSYAYLNLTRAIPKDADAEYIEKRELRGNPDNPEVHWISNMSVPTMQEPYTAGAAKSNIIKRLESGHGSTGISQAEIDKIALWIDLVVPYIGDYREANNWSAEEMEFYDYYDSKRQDSRQAEIKAIEEYLVSLNK